MILPFRLGLAEFRRRTPTTDLYVLNPLGRLAEQARGALPPVRHLFGNIHAVGATCIISRTASPDDLRRLEALKFRRIVYVVDDDFAAGAADPLLPAAYRAKLGAFATGPLAQITAMADAVLASSPVIAAAYGAKARVLHPAWRLPPADLKHFHRSGRIEIAHLGTASHAADFDALADSMHTILDDHPKARLSFFVPASCPPSLKAHPQVRVRRAMPWWLYKHVVPRLRFHLALYPLRDSSFNAARSANKLFEHAQVGAASLMSPNPALRAVAPDASDIFVEGGAEAWDTRIRRDLAEPLACRERAARTSARIKALNPLDAAAQLWRDVLELRAP